MHHPMIRAISPIVTLLEGSYNEFLNRQQPNKEAFRHFLYNTYSYVKETVPTIMSVVEAAPDHPLVNRLLAKAEEEAGHDVLFWRDLQTIGLPNIIQRSPFIDEFVALELATRNEPDPVSSLYGDFLILECNPPTEASITLIQEAFGLPPEALRAMRLHAAVDGEQHRDEILADLELNVLDVDCVLKRAVHVGRLFTKHWDWMRDERWFDDGKETAEATTIHSRSSKSSKASA